MPDTQLESNMDSYVKSNLPVYMQVFRRDGQSWVPLSGTQDLDSGISYRLDLSVLNNGTETFARNIQVRCVRPDGGKVRYYRNDAYDTEVTRADGPVWTEVVAPNQMSPTHSVHFKVVNDPDSGDLRSIANVGVYAEIVPQGHAWTTLKWKM